MAYGNWDKIIGEYKNLYIPSRYGQEAIKTLEIIPKLRASSLLSRVTPFTSLGTLGFKIPGKETEVMVLPKVMENEFRVRLYLPSRNKIIEEHNVSKEEIVSELEKYVKQVKQDSTIP